MSKRAKPETPTRSAPKVQNKEPPRPTVFARAFPILVIISAVVLYIVTLPEEPTITSSPQQNSNPEKSFSQYKEGASLSKILSDHYKTADVKLKSLTTLSNPSKPSNQNTGHTIKKLAVSVSSDTDKDKSVHLIAKEFGSYVHPRNVTWTPRTEINPSTLEYCSEKAVLQGLNMVIQPEKQIWPAYIGSDDATGIIVSKHLSSSMTLCDVLKKERSLLTEDLFSKFGQTLADFHRSTQDKAHDFDQLISTATHGHMNHDETLEEDLEVFVQSREVLNEIWPALGVSKVPNFDTELDTFEKELRQLTQRRKTGLNSKSDPFYMLTHGDLCPDNVLLRYDKSQKHIDQLYFVDYSRSGIRNIFYDITFMRMTFPTCWCTEKLPTNFIKTFESAYKSRWEGSLTASQFGSQLTKWSLYHVITTIADLLPRVWEKDLVLSGYSLRQRIVDRVNAYLTTFSDPELNTSEKKNDSASKEQLEGLLLVLYETWPQTKH